MSLKKGEMIKREVTAIVGMAGFEITLSLAESVVGVDKNGQYRFERFQASEKASTPSSQPRYVVPNIGIRAFDDMRVVFVVDIALVFSSKDHVQITRAPIRVVILRLWRPVDHGLYCLCLYRVLHLECYDLTRLAAHHCHYIRVYTVLVTLSCICKPVYFIQLKRVKFRRRTYPQVLAFFLPPHAPIGTRSPCSCSAPCPLLCRYSPMPVVATPAFAHLHYMPCFSDSACTCACTLCSTSAGSLIPCIPSSAALLCSHTSDSALLSFPYPYFII